MEETPTTENTAAANYTITVHDGKAHMDELLAAALVAIYKGALPREIRRIPSRQAAEETAALSNSTAGVPNASNAAQRPLPSEERWYLDCGLQLDPGRRLFDHHQSRELPSAALLTADRLFPDLAGTSLHEYLEILSKVDTGGLISLDDFDQLSESRRYWPFPQKILLKIFESQPLTLLGLLVPVLQDKIQFEKDKETAARWLAAPENTAVRTISAGKTPLKVLEYRAKPPEELISALRSADGPLVDEEEIHLIYSYDDRDPENRVLFRTNHGHTLLDLTQTAPSHPVFCHASGFLLKFRPGKPAEWETLVRQSAL